LIPWQDNHPHINYDESIGRGQIRLLKLLPGPREVPLRTEFISCQLADRPEYEALSYVWGSMYSGEQHICVGEQQLSIGPNLASALRTFRQLDRPRYIWVDALCINQMNMEEKSEQISQLNEVYQNADNVLVWLGEHDAHSAYGIEAVKYFVDPTTVAPEAPWLSNFSEAYATGLKSILERGWWKRIWTVQEAALAKRVTLTCGDHQVSWKVDLSTLQRAKFKLKLASTSPEWEGSDFEEVDLLPLIEVVESQLREVMEVSSLRLEKDLLDVVYDFRHRHATYEADKVYAILNLAEGRRTDLTKIPGGLRYGSRDHARDLLTRLIGQLYPDVQIAGEL
jgi:hypothetical protein